jgi:serine/threonine protein kinase
VGKDHYALVLQLIEGSTLDDLVKQKGPLHPEDASWAIERLLAALYFCHDNGVIHGDIKPENIFVEPKKHDIKLIDFGLATYRPKAGTKPVGYTPRYAAPELRDGKPPIPETDLYGAGIALTYALTGDVEEKRFPKGTPTQLIDFANALTRYDPTARPRWETDNPIRKLSDIRFEEFGRRHCSQSATL